MNTLEETQWFLIDERWWNDYLWTRCLSMKNLCILNICFLQKHCTYNLSWLVKTNSIYHDFFFFLSLRKCRCNVAIMTNSFELIVRCKYNRFSENSRIKYEKQNEMTECRLVYFFPSSLDGSRQSPDRGLFNGNISF